MWIGCRDIMAMPTIFSLIEVGGKISSEKMNSIELNQKPLVAPSMKNILSPNKLI
jgi:hypothetical protein